MVAPSSQFSPPLTQDLDYLLRRAEEETIAQIRASNAIVAQRHGDMAQAYSARAQAMLASASSL